jgi:hypothetical protein
VGTLIEPPRSSKSLMPISYLPPNQNAFERQRDLHVFLPLTAFKLDEVSDLHLSHGSFSPSSQRAPKALLRGYITVKITVESLKRAVSLSLADMTKTLCFQASASICDRRYQSRRERTRSVSNGDSCGEK